MRSDYSRWPMFIWDYLELFWPRPDLNRAQVNRFCRIPAGPGVCLRYSVSAHRVNAAGWLTPSAFHPPTLRPGGLRELPTPPRTDRCRHITGGKYTWASRLVLIIVHGVRLDIAALIQVATQSLVNQSVENRLGTKPIAKQHQIGIHMGHRIRAVPSVAGVRIDFSSTLAHSSDFTAPALPVNLTVVTANSRFAPSSWEEEVLSFIGQSGHTIILSSCFGGIGMISS